MAASRISSNWMEVWEAGSTLLPPTAPAPAAVDIAPTISLRAPRRVAMDLCVSLCMKGRGGGAEEEEKVLLLLPTTLPSSIAPSLYLPLPLRMDLSRLKAEEGAVEEEAR